VVYLLKTLKFFKLSHKKSSHHALPTTNHPHCPKAQLFLNSPLRDDTNFHLKNFFGSILITEKGAKMKEKEKQFSLSHTQNLIS
jgi:hypothetical protein